MQLALTRSHLAQEHLALGPLCAGAGALSADSATDREPRRPSRGRRDSGSDRPDLLCARPVSGSAQIIIAKRSQRWMLPTPRWEFAQALVNLSQAYWATGRYAEALPPAERAVLALASERHAARSGAALTAAGYCQLALNHPAEARQAFSEAVSIIEKLRAQTSGGPEESERYFEGGLQAHRGLLSLLAKKTNRVTRSSSPNAPKPARCSMCCSRATSASRKP